MRGIEQRFIYTLILLVNFVGFGNAQSSSLVDETNKLLKKGKISFTENKGQVYTRNL